MKVPLSQMKKAVCVLIDTYTFIQNFFYMYKKIKYLFKNWKMEFDFSKSHI